MAGSTTILALPYTTGTDKVVDGDNAIKSLADKLDGPIASTAVAGTLNGTTGSIVGHRRPGSTFVAVDVTIGAALNGVTGAVVGYVPSGCNPPATLHYMLCTTGSPAVVHLVRVIAAGNIELVNSATTGTRLIGTLVLPR